MKNPKKVKPTKADLEFMDKIDEVLAGDKVTKQQKITVNNKSNNQSKKEYYIEYNGIKRNINQIGLSDHAYKRTVERMNVQNKGHAIGTIRGNLKKAKLIGKQISEDGTESIVYAHGKMAIHLATDLKTIVTVIPCKQVTYQPIKLQLTNLHKKELEKLERKKKYFTNHLPKEKLETEKEIIDLKLQLLKTNSLSKQLALKAYIKAHEMYLEQLDSEYKEIDDHIRQVTRSMVSVM